MLGKLKLISLGLLIWLVSELTITGLAEAGDFSDRILWAILSISASILFAIKMNRPAEVRWGLVLVPAGLAFSHMAGAIVAGYIISAYYRHRQRSKPAVSGGNVAAGEAEQLITQLRMFLAGVKIRYFVLWYIFSLFGSVAAAYSIAGHWFKSFDVLIVSNIGYIVYFSLLLFWLLGQTEKYRISLGAFIGPYPKSGRWLTALLLIIGTGLFSTGAGMLVLYAESFFFPGHVQEILAYHPLQSGAGTTAFAHRLLWGIIVVIIGPIMEELIFRGLILRRLAWKRNIKYGLIVSSLLFSLLHGADGAPGAFAAGMVLAVLYLQAETLVLPIMVHMFNNAVAYGFAWASLKDQQPYLLEQLQADAWIGAALVLLSLPGIIYYLRRNWPAAEPEDDPRHEIILCCRSSEQKGLQG